MAYDYPAIDEDELEGLKPYGPPPIDYAPALPPAGDGANLGAVPPAHSGAYAPIESASTLPLSTVMPQVPKPAVKPVAPTAQDYAAAGPHGWRKALAILGPSLLAAGGNSRGAEAMGQQLFQAPKEKLDTDYQQELKQYDTEEQEQEREAQQEEIQRHDKASEATAKEAVEKKEPKTLTPEEQTIHDLMTGENGQPRINPQTNKPYSYMEAYGAVKQAGQKPAQPKVESPEAQAFDDYIKQGMTPQQAFEKVREKPPGQEPGSYMPVNDAKGNTVGWIDPKSGHFRSASTIPGLSAAVGGQGAIPPKPTTQARNVQAQAQVAVEGIPDTLKEIDSLKDQLGPVAGRWNEFMQGKVGMDNERLAGLRMDLIMLSSAVALAHARGRLPENL